MANLKDLLVNGPSNLIGDVTVNKIRLTSLEVNNGTTYDPGSNGQVLKSNGTSVYWSDDNNSITGVKGNTENSYRTGNVNITQANIIGSSAIGTNATPIYWNGSAFSAGRVTFDSLTGNRLVWTTELNKIYAGYHYADSEHIGIKSTSQPSQTFYVNGSTGLNGNLFFTSAGHITWNNGNYQQRIYLTDDSTSNTPVFTFQQSSDAGNNWTNLMTIKDNGSIIATTFVGDLTGTASRATADANGNTITSTYKTKQDAVADVAVTNATATEFISSVTQDTNGVILVEKKKLPNVVTYTQNNNVSVPGASADATTTKTVYKYNQTTIYTPNGLIMGGTAQNAGLATRGICGISTPNNNTGAATKDNLYINFDGDTTYRVNRQLILQAGTYGTNYGNNVYQYAAVRGDAMKAWVEAKGYSTTDEKVKQNIETSNANYPVLFSYSTSPTSGTNEYVKYTDKITINPYDGCISPSISGLYDLGKTDARWNKLYVNEFAPDEEYSAINIQFSNVWQDLKDSSENLIHLSKSGTYIVQIYDDSHNTGASGHWKTYWSGIFSWYAGDVNGSGEYTEISLHGVGHAMNKKSIQLRTCSPLSSTMKFQIKGNLSTSTNTTNNTISIKFKFIM